MRRMTSKMVTEEMRGTAEAFAKARLKRALAQAEEDAARFATLGLLGEGADLHDPRAITLAYDATSRLIARANKALDGEID